MCQPRLGGSKDKVRHVKITGNKRSIFGIQSTCLLYRGLNGWTGEVTFFYSHLSVQEILVIKGMHLIVSGCFLGSRNTSYNRYACACLWVLTTYLGQCILVD